MLAIKAHWQICIHVYLNTNSYDENTNSYSARHLGAFFLRPKPKDQKS